MYNKIIIAILSRKYNKHRRRTVLCQRGVNLSNNIKISAGTISQFRQISYFTGYLYLLYFIDLLLAAAARRTAAPIPASGRITLVVSPVCTAF